MTLEAGREMGSKGESVEKLGALPGPQGVLIVRSPEVQGEPAMETPQSVTRSGKTRKMCC